MASLISTNPKAPRATSFAGPLAETARAKLPYVLMVVVVSALVIGLAFTALGLERQRHFERAAIATQNVVALLDQHLEGMLNSVDIVLQSVAFHYREHMVPSHSGVASVDVYLKEQKSLLPEITNLRILDRDGIVRVGHDPAEDVSMSLADRDFFVRARNEPTAGLIIAGPMFGRISKQWIMVLARRLNNLDGSFAGVVIATIETSRFDAMLSAPELGPRGAATIRTSDLALVHRHPITKGAVGSGAVGSREVSKQLQESVRLQPSKGEYTAVVAIDGVERINAYRQLEHYPFIVLAGLAVDDFIGEWRTHSLILVGLAGLAILTAVIAALGLYRAAQRQLVDQRNRERVREQDAILNSNVLGIAVIKDRTCLWCNQRLARMLGYEREEVIGQSTLIVYPDDEDSDAFADQVGSKIRAGELCTFERQYKRKDGSLGWFELCGQHMTPEGGESIWSVADITDRKQAELQLRESEGRFRAIFENIDAIAIQGYRLDGTVTYWNPASEKIYGYTAAEAMGAKLLDLIIPPEMHARVNEAVSWMFENKQGVPAGCLQLRNKNGKSLHVYSSHAVIDDALGNRTLFCLDIDQSAQVQMEADLLQREHFIDAVVEHAGNVIVVLDAAGCIVRFNHAAEELSGYGFDELDGKPIWDYLIPPEQQADVRAVFDDLMHERLVGSFENEWLRKDGSRRLLDWRNTILRDAEGHVSHVVALGYDITALRQHEHELETYRDHLEHLVNARTAEAEAARVRTQMILDSSADGIIELDAQGIVRMINPATSSILGYRPEDLLGRNVHDSIHYLHADGSPYPASDCAVVDAVIAGKKLRLDSDVFWHANGQPVPVAVATHPIWQDDRVVGAVISFFDVSERAKVEQAREEARQAAEQLAKIKSEFLANMSHEIRTPLNGVLGLAQIGYRDSVGRSKSQETFARILDSGRLLLTIINDILDFSKIEAGKLHIEAIPFDPGNVADDAIHALENAVANKSIRLIGEKAADLPTACLGDPVRISQVLLNLLSNAVKFTSQGEVRLGARREGGELVFEVADSGIGIPASQIERLFMPFEQADGSTTRQFGGTGLGLAISRRLAEMMGGSLAATSQVGHGSSFILRLPLQETNQTVLRGIRAASSSGKRLAGLRILVAEDNEVNQLVMEDILRREGAAIEIVGNGRLAVDAIDRGELFDAVLMDVQMPVMDGLEATRELGRRLPDLPVIGQTAHALKAEHDKCLAAGMVATIIKPIDIDLLVANVLHHVGSPDHRGALPPPVIEDHSPQELQVIDWDALRQTYPGRPEFIDRMVSIVLHRHQNDAELLRTLVSMLDLKGIHQLAHTLKGLGGNLHAPELSRVAMRAMHAARAESAEALALALELAVAVDRLMEFLGQGKPAPR